MRIVIAEAGQEYRIAGDRRVRTPQDIADIASDIVHSVTECLAVLYLDGKNGLRAFEVVSNGIADASLVHPREVFRPAVERSASAIALVHNHPSGDVTPSAEDVRVTRQLIEAGTVMGIKVVDHVIVAPAPPGEKDRWNSLRESGVCVFL